jgi:hypothetical protein
MARLSSPTTARRLTFSMQPEKSTVPLAFPEPCWVSYGSLCHADVVTFHERSWRPGRVLVYTGEPIGAADSGSTVRASPAQAPGPVAAGGGCANAHRLRLPAGLPPERVLRPRSTARSASSTCCSSTSTLAVPTPGSSSTVSSAISESANRKVLDLLLPHLRHFCGPPRAVPPHKARPRAHLTRAGGRRARRRGPDQPRDRPAARHLPHTVPQAPRERVREARYPHAKRARWRRSSVGPPRRQARTGATAPGRPFSRCSPRGSKRSSEPATRSFTVLETRISPAEARDAMRAPIDTAKPATLPSETSQLAVVCRPPGSRGRAHEASHGSPTRRPPRAPARRRRRRSRRPPCRALRPWKRASSRRHDGVMPLEQLPPGRIAERRRPLWSSRRCR